MEPSFPKKGNELVSRTNDVEAHVSNAVLVEARRSTVKEFARDAEVSIQRGKQLRVDPGNVRASTLILLAQKRPELRSLLVQLMHAECGEGDNPAVILDRISRLIR